MVKYDEIGAGSLGSIPASVKLYTTKCYHFCRTRSAHFGPGKSLVTTPASAAVKFQFYVFQVDSELSQAIRPTRSKRS